MSSNQNLMEIYRTAEMKKRFLAKNKEIDSARKKYSENLHDFIRELSKENKRHLILKD